MLNDTTLVAETGLEFTILTGTCFFCNELAQVNCEECGKFFYLNNSYLCDRCSGLTHKHPARVGHKPERDFPELELLSVLCIETSHYVCFSRDSEGRWLFFDSMANRVRELTLTNKPLIDPLSHQMTSSTFPEEWTAQLCSMSGCMRETRRS